MQNITYGPGVLFLRTNDGKDVSVNVNDTVVEYEDVYDATCALGFKLPNSGEATLELNNVKIDRRLWWKLTLGKPWQWPVSNNWLKIHGHDMRRQKQLKKINIWLLNRLVARLSTEWRCTISERYVPLTLKQEIIDAAIKLVNLLAHNDDEHFSDIIGNAVHECDIGKLLDIEESLFEE